MRVGLSRKTIASTMEKELFSAPLSCLMGPAREVVSLVTSSNYSDRKLFNMMDAYISNKVTNLGGKLSAFFVEIDGKRKKLDYTTCDDLMMVLIRRQSDLIVKVMVKNKYFEFTIENGGEQVSTEVSGSTA